MANAITKVIMSIETALGILRQKSIAVLRITVNVRGLRVTVAPIQSLINAHAAVDVWGVWRNIVAWGHTAFSRLRRRRRADVRLCGVQSPLQGMA